MLRRSLIALAIGLAVTTSAAEQAAKPPVLFDLTSIFDVHLTFTPEQYAALTPATGTPLFGRGGRPGQSWLQGPDGKRNGLASAMGLEFAYVHADVLIGDRSFADSGVRYKGNGTYLQGRSFGKVSFKVDLNRFVKGQKLGAVKTFNLHSNITDASYMNEPLAFRLYRDANVPAPRTSYARVFITVTGQRDKRYAGLFSLVENPDDVFLAERGMNGAGAIFKPVTSSLFSDLGNDWARYNQTYDPKTDLTDAQKQRVINAAQLVTSASDSDFLREAGNFIDIEAAARYFAVAVFLSDMDSILGFGQNYYMYLDPDTNRFSFMAWDQDHSWGQFPQAPGPGIDILKPWSSANRFLERLFSLPAFRELYIAKLREFSTTLFQPARIATQVDEVAAAIRPAVAEESAQRLERLNALVANVTAPPPTLELSGFGRFVRTGPAQPIKPFVITQAKSVAEQLSRLP